MADIILQEKIRNRIISIRGKKYVVTNCDQLVLY